MRKKWVLPLLLALPFVPVLIWGFQLPEAAYVWLTSPPNPPAARIRLLDPGAPAQELLTTPIWPVALGVLGDLGLDREPLAVVLSTLGWGAAAIALWWFGRQFQLNAGALAAALLLTFNPWIIPTLGQATGWVIALIWLLASFVARQRFLIAIAGALFLLSLFFLPSQGFLWPAELLQPLIWSLLLFAAGAFLEWFAHYLVENGRVARSERQVLTLFLGLLLLVTGTWQGVQLLQQVQNRPLARWAVQEEAAAWLATQTAEEATLFASDRIAYLAGRENLGRRPQDLLELLPGDLPDYVVTGAGLEWRLLQEAIWFRAYYDRVWQENDPEAPQSGLEIWAYRPPSYGQPLTLLNARVPDRLSVLGYQIQPPAAAAGEEIELALTLQRPPSTAVPAVPFLATVRLVAPWDGQSRQEWLVELPRSRPAGAWEPGVVLVERLPLALPPDLESGAYQLNLSLAGRGEPELWPFSLDNDVNRLDRIPLGYVVLPEAAGEPQSAVEADFAQGIQLAGFDAGEAAAGETLQVRLVWRANQAVEDNYDVFVHLLNGEGALVANHDGPPANGRFPTRSWLPGQIISDTHAIPLPPDLPPGTYTLRSGLYDPQTGARLPVWFAAGTPQDGDAVTLGTVTVR